jgi:hypothetical protein
MNRRTALAKLLAVTLWGVSTAVPAVSQCSPELDHLLVALQNDKTSNDAMLDLISRGKDPEVKKCLAERLPVLLDRYKPRNDGIPDFVWGSEAGVVAELRIAEAAPALSRRIDMLTSWPMGGSVGYNFHERAADYALIDIGAPATPFVIEVLKHGSTLQREIAAHVLRYIGTGAAWRALEDALPGEKDPKVRARIQEALNSRH